MARLKGLKVCRLWEIAAMLGTCQLGCSKRDAPSMSSVLRIGKAFRSLDSC